MAQTDRNTIKTWFQKGMKPLASQFTAWLDSYWHKEDSIPVDSIDNLQQILNSKQDKQVIVNPDEISVYDPASPYNVDSYVSFINPGSVFPDFQTESIYRCKEYANINESPETSTSKWVRQGSAIGSIKISSVVDLQAELQILTSENAAQNTSISNLYNYIEDSIAEEANTRAEADTALAQQYQTIESNVVALNQSCKSTTVGTGGRFATIPMALQAGYRRITLVSNIEIETTQNWVVVSDIVIDLNGYSINVQEYAEITSDDYVRTAFEHGTIHFTQSVFTQEALHLQFVFTRVRFEAHGSGTFVRSNYGTVFEDCAFYMLDEYCGLFSGANLTVRGLRIIGAGTVSYGALALTGSFNISDLTLEGVFSRASDVVNIENSSPYSSITNIKALYPALMTCNGQSPILDGVHGFGVLSGFCTATNFSTDEWICGPQNQSLVDGVIGSFTNNTRKLTVDTVKFSTSISINGNDSRFINCTFADSLTLNASRCVIQGCQVGTSAGSTRTIIISGGAYAVTIANCTVEVAILNKSSIGSNIFDSNRLWGSYALLADSSYKGSPLPSTTGAGSINCRDRSDYAGTITGAVTWTFDSFVKDDVIFLNVTSNTFTVNLDAAGVTFKGDCAGSNILNLDTTGKANLIAVWFESSTSAWVKVTKNR